MRVFTRWLAAVGKFARPVQAIPLARAKAFYGGIDHPQHSIARSLGSACRQLLTGAVLLGLACASHPAHALLEDGPNGSINAVAQDDNGITYVGGSFTHWGTRTGGVAALDRSTGGVNRAFPFVDGIVHAVAPDGAGGWYIGGTFTAVGGLPRNKLAQIDSNGNVTSWNPGVDGYSPVYALAVSGNTVYVGGDFHSVGRKSRHRLAAINRDGSVSNWNPAANRTDLALPMDGATVRALAVDGATVYIGGSFGVVAGTSRQNLAAVGIDGALAAWNPGVSGSGVRALAVRGNTVYVGGSFTSVGGVTRNRLAAIRTDDQATLLDWNPNLDGMVAALAVNGGTVYVGGYFSTVGGQPRTALAAIGADGNATAWNPNLIQANVAALAVSGSSIYVGGGGNLGGVGGAARIGLAEIDFNGAVTAWDPLLDDWVGAVAVSGTTVYAGGYFKYAGAKRRVGLAAIGHDGDLTGWNPDASYGEVYALTVGGGLVYAGGNFLTMSGQQRHGVAAIGTDGILSAWNPDVAVDPPPIMPVIGTRTVYALTRVADTIYVGGRFLSVGGQPRANLAAVGTDGTLLPGNLDTDGAVYALSARGDMAYVGGDFTKIGGQAHRAVAAVDKSGALSAWDPNVSSVGWSSVNTIAVGGDTLYLGGQFSLVGGQPRKNLAAVNMDGTPTAWNPGADSSVAALAVGGERVYAGYGVFGYFSGVSQHRYVLEAINFDGQRVAWNPNPNGAVNALAACGNAVCAGGGFTSIANQVWPGSASLYFARLIPATAFTPITTTMTLVGAPSGPTTYGATVALTATLSPVATGGTVNFMDGGTTIPGCQSVPINTATGVSACITATLSGGPHSLSAVYAGFDAYQPSTSAPYTHSVNVAIQTIAFGTVPAVMVGGRGWVDATGGASGNPVVFSSLTSTICGVSGSMVQGLALGTCTIAANQAGSVNFSAAAQVIQSIVVRGGDTWISGWVEQTGVVATIGGGTWGFAPQGTGSLQSGGFIPLQGHPKSPPTPPPAGLQFPYGLFDFVALGGTPGSTLSVTITYNTYPHPLRPNMQYWKYGATALDPTPHWYQYGNASISGNTVTLTITDGGPGDGDQSANGMIVDPGGLVDPTPPTAIPTLDARSLWLLASLMLLAGMARLRSRQSS